jgi:hypothetical protein
MVAIKKKEIKKLLVQLNKAKQNENHLELIFIGNILIREQIKVLHELILKKQVNHALVKFNTLLIELIAQPIDSDGSSVKIIAKKNLKAVKLWKDKFDSFFKGLKKEVPTGTKPLADETLKIAAMLQTTITKI